MTSQPQDGATDLKPVYRGGLQYMKEMHAVLEEKRLSAVIMPAAQCIPNA